MFNNYISSPSSPPPRPIELLQNIMQNGANEFKQKTGRNMTYSEMREMYG